MYDEIIQSVSSGLSSITAIADGVMQRLTSSNGVNSFIGIVAVGVVYLLHHNDSITRAVLAFRGAFSSFRDRKLNRYKAYGAEYVSRNTENRHKVEYLFIEYQINEGLLTRLTGINGYMTKRIFMFLAIKDRWKYGESKLIKIIDYIYLDEDKVFKINLTRCNQKRLGCKIVSMTCLVFMVYAILVFSKIVESHHYSQTVIVFSFLAIILFEIFCLHYHFKIPNRELISKYAKHLAKIDTREFARPE